MNEVKERVKAASEKLGYSISDVTGALLNLAACLQHLVAIEDNTNGVEMNRIIHSIRELKSQLDYISNIKQVLDDAQK